VTDLAASSDAQLIALLAEGDEAALIELYDRHAPWLSVRLVRRCHDDDLASQVLQDSFLGVWRSARSWRGDGEVAAWLWGIAFRQLISQLRRTNRSVLLHAIVPAVEPTTESAEDLVLLSVGYGDVGSALAALAPELRAVIQLTALDGLTEREAARLLGLPVGTTKGRIRKAKKVLREQLVGTAVKEGWV
jgi:RNA polymerase sigma factor (sigma-70 family)